MIHVISSLIIFFNSLVYYILVTLIKHEVLANKHIGSFHWKVVSLVSAILLLYLNINKETSLKQLYNADVKHKK